MLKLATGVLGTLTLAWVAAAVGLVLSVHALVDRARLRRRWASLADAQEKLADGLWEVKAAGEARQRAEAQAGAKGRFVATISHEVRTPLNGILGMAELLGGTKLDAEQQAYLDAIQSSGRALAALVDEVLDFSRLEAGRADLAAEPFDLAGVVEGVAELLGPRAQEKGLEIAARLEPDVPATVVGDAARLRQVLVNLAGNAVKFTQAGGVGLRVAVAPEGGLHFTVADTGPGVPPARRAAIFEAFERGGAAGDGTGLGLAIARQLVGLMGSGLTLADRASGGSVFGFTVPLVVPDEGPERPRAALPDLAGRTALIVADSPFQAPYLAQDLGRAGARVTIAGTEAEARAVLDRGTAFDLLLVDCALGEDAAGRLARAAPGVGRALLLFSPSERHAFGQLLAAEFDGWLVKPVRTRSLLARIADEAPPPAPAGARPASHPADLRVLLAEDNEINTLVMLKMLDRIGASVTHVADGALALNAALAAMRGETDRFDTILIDLSMPGLGGQEAARRLRSAERGAGAHPTRIVAVTAYAFDDDRQACFEAGIDEFLTKPIDLARLRAALARGTAPALTA